MMQERLETEMVCSDLSISCQASKTMDEQT
nr:MAG TPA: hypothetical protein [Bacteriophage sp.]